MADLKQFERKMEKTLEVLASDFGAVRAGRANAQVLDRITVEYYGTPTPIGQVGTISSPDPRTLVIQPWDGSLLKTIEKAIQHRLACRVHRFFHRIAERFDVRVARRRADQEIICERRNVGNLNQADILAELAVECLCGDCRHLFC